jgi:cell division septation protein DedD
MIKAILGTIGILAGLGIAIYFLFYGNQAKPLAPKPPAQTQVAVQPAPAPQPPAASQPTPPPSGPAAPPAAAPGPPPAPPQKESAPLPTLEPKKEHGLVVGKFRRYKDAQRLLDKIMKKHQSGFIRKEGKYYNVWIGPFATPQEVERARKSIKAAYKISPQKRDYEVPVPK